MSLTPQQSKWYFALAVLYAIAVIVDVTLIPNGYEWRWVNFGVDQVKMAAIFALVALMWPRRWVHVSLVVVWVAVALFTFPRSL
ncbi:hypothetical protein [Deinococcus radiotolerans]|uniref:hypothetical protein n=1 Tax=Deinococcus radiotolerans TaxID=1309407 RepID=UPI00166834B4|nr:hypothetical protein [Deinococcus radiotolerans]